MYTYIYIYMHICIYVCMCIYIYIYIHIIHIYILRGLPVVSLAPPEFRANFTGIHRNSNNFSRISNGSTFKKGMTTTRPSHKSGCEKDCKIVAAARRLAGCGPRSRRNPSRVLLPQLENVMRRAYVCCSL